MSKVLETLKKLKIPRKEKYFCSEPWTGILDIKPNQDVVFCPCYLRLKIGSLKESTMQDIWNAEELQEMRTLFDRGKLPEICKGQLCPPILKEGYQLKQD